MCENQKESLALPMIGYSKSKDSCVCCDLRLKWLYLFIYDIFQIPDKQSAENVLAKQVVVVLFFEGYKISVWIFHLPHSQLFVAADLQNKHNAGRIEEHANRHPGHPPHPHPETFTGDVHGSVTFGSHKPDADIVHQAQP